MIHKCLYWDYVHDTQGFAQVVMVGLLSSNYKQCNMCLQQLMFARNEEQLMFARNEEQFMLIDNTLANVLYSINESSLKLF